MTSTAMRTVRLCLIGTALSLLLVGVIGGTPVRYAVQLLSIVLAWRLASRAPGYLGAYAAVVICIFWAVRVVLIWLFVLGMSDVGPGDYPPVVIALTAPVAFFAVVGILRGVREGRLLGQSRKVITLILFTALQVLVTLASFMEPFANRHTLGISPLPGLLHALDQGLLSRGVRAGIVGPRGWRHILVRTAKAICAPDALLHPPPIWRLHVQVFVLAEQTYFGAAALFTPRHRHHA